MNENYAVQASLRVYLKEFTNWVRGSEVTDWKLCHWTLIALNI